MEDAEKGKELIMKFLKKNNYSVTKPRLEILFLLYNASNWMGLFEIEKNTGKKYNRTTTYRTLLSMQKEKLLFKIVDNKRNAFYFLNRDVIDNYFEKKEEGMKCLPCKFEGIHQK